MGSCTSSSTSTPNPISAGPNSTLPVETKAISNVLNANEQTPIKVENVILEPSNISSEKSEEKIIENANPTMEVSTVLNSENVVESIEKKDVAPEFETATVVVEEDKIEVQPTIAPAPAPATVVTESAPATEESVPDEVVVPHVELTIAPAPAPAPVVTESVPATEESLPDEVVVPHVEPTIIESAPSQETKADAVEEDKKEVIEKEETAPAAPAESAPAAEESAPASPVEDAHVELTTIEASPAPETKAEAVEPEVPVKESITVEAASPAPAPVPSASPAPVPSASPSAKASPPAAKMGYISKLGQEYKTWKKRFFVLKDGILTYYEKDQTQAPFGVNHKGEVCLRHMVFEEKSETVTMTSNGKGDRDLIVKIPSPKERAEWLDAMKAHAAYHFK